METIELDRRLIVNGQFYNPVVDSLRQIRNELKLTGLRDGEFEHESITDLRVAPPKLPIVEIRRPVRRVRHENSLCLA